MIAGRRAHRCDAFSPAEIDNPLRLPPPIRVPLFGVNARVGKILSGVVSSFGEIVDALTNVSKAMWIDLGLDLGKVSPNLGAKTTQV